MSQLQKCNRLHNLTRLRLLAGLATLTLTLAALTLIGCATSSSPAAAGSSSTAIPAVAPGRAVWFWESAAQEAIVDTPSLQPATIANFKSWNVTSVYGSYGSQIISNPAAVRQWNALLASNGIASYSLVSTGNFFLPEQWSATQAWLQTNYLSFNAAATAPGQAFVGIAFDVEPASFTGNATRLSWDASTTAGRRTYLTYFNDMLQSSRSFLNANGASAALMQTYLVTWFSTLNSSIGWADVNDRNAWFAQLAGIVDRITVEQYETSSIPTITTGYQTNDTLLLGKSRVALNSNDTVWPTATSFFTGVTATEAATTKFVDIEDYDTTAAK